MIHYTDRKINSNLSFSPFYFNRAKLNVLKINGHVFFFAQEIARSLKYYDRTSRYLRKYVNNCDIKRIKFRQYKGTVFNVFWHCFNFAPKLLLNIDGATILVKHLDRSKLSSFKDAVGTQIFQQQTLDNCLLKTNGFRRMLDVLKKHPQWQSRLHINLNGFNKNQDTFINASTIAHEDYHCSLYHLNKLLEVFHVQFKVNERGPYRLIHPNREYAEVVNFGNRKILKWHPDGRSFIHKIMSKHGIRHY